MTDEWNMVFENCIFDTLTGFLFPLFDANGMGSYEFYNNGFTNICGTFYSADSGSGATVFQVTISIFLTSEQHSPEHRPYRFLPNFGNESI